MGVIQLSWFEEPNAFHVAIGADDAPFGKHDQAKGWRNMWQSVTRIFYYVGPIVQNHIQVCQSTAGILFTILPIFNQILSVWATNK